MWGPCEREQLHRIAKTVAVACWLIGFGWACMHSIESFFSSIPSVIGDSNINLMNIIHTCTSNT
jgi:hypothetical protein